MLRPAFSSVSDHHLNMEIASGKGGYVRNLQQKASRPGSNSGERGGKIIP